MKIYYRLPFASAKAVIDVCDARRIPCTAHLELLDARELIAAGLHGIEHMTSFGVSLLPRKEAEAYRQAVLKNNDARRDGRYRVFSDADLDGPEAQALYTVLRARKPFLDPTLAVFERRPPSPTGWPTSRHASGRGQQPDLTPMRVAGFAKMKQLTRRAAREGARVVSVVTPRCRLRDGVKPHGGKWSCWSRAGSRRSRPLPRQPRRPRLSCIAATSSGSLRAGFNADLVVLRGQPDRDIAAIRTVDRVMVGGRWIDTAKYRSVLMHLSRLMCD